jgi:hypothetical protein
MFSAWFMKNVSIGLIEKDKVMKSTASVGK